MPNERLLYLFDHYMNNTCSEKEEEELAALAITSGNDNEIRELLGVYWEKITGDEDMPEVTSKSMLKEIFHPGREEMLSVQNKVRPLFWKRLAIAASVLLVIGLGGYLLFFNKPGKQTEVVKTEPAIDVEAPKVAKATITLADGRTVSIDSITSGMLAQQSNVTVTKTVNGKIVYAGNANEVVYNTLSNPRGSQVIDMTFADGSHVWLNAGSSVTFPVTFIGSERKVSVTGEAYFEVTHNATMPFKVGKDEMEVMVLGTHFNVNAYENESDIKVTLLEGSVQVSIGTATGILKPGQQARITKDVKIINNVDLEEVIAWKNGRFQFEGAGIDEVMRQVARWYDVEVVYPGALPSGTFEGKIGRDLSLAQLLNGLSSTRIKYKLEGGNRLVILPE